MVAPRANIKPLTAALIISLLIHGGLLAVITVNSYMRPPTVPARVDVGAGSSRVSFLASEGAGNGGHDASLAAENKSLPQQAEPIPRTVATPPVVSETAATPVKDDAPAVLLVAADSAVGQGQPANNQPGDNSSVAIGGSGSATGSGTGLAVGGSGEGSGAGSNAGYGSNPAPVYPREALEHRWQGTVLLRVEVRADGTVARLEIVEGSGHSVLDESSLAAVRSWKFQPARSGATPIPSVVEIPINFRLEH